MLRKHIERIVRFPVTTILLAVFITVFFAFQISGLHMVLDPKALLPQDHPYVKLNNEIEKQFGGSRVVLIGVASKDGYIYNPQDIEKIRQINEEVKKLPGILENNVVSIADRKVKYVKAEGDSLDIKGLLEGIENTPEGMKELKDRVYSNPAFINSLISKDGTVAAIITDFKGGAGDWLQKQGKAGGSSEQVDRRDEVDRSRDRPSGLSEIDRRDEVDRRDRPSGLSEVADKSIPIGGVFQPRYSGPGMSRLSEISVIAPAWAQEDWKKWQGKGTG